ncbi:unnamed protein product, partial [Symbiodinium sp. KB8]
MSGEESDDPQTLPEEPEVLSSPEPEVLSSPESWTAGLDGSVSAPPPPILVPGELTAMPAVKASKAAAARGGGIGKRTKHSATDHAAQSGIPCSFVGPSSSVHHGGGGLRGRSLGNLEATTDSDLNGQFFNFAAPVSSDSTQGVYFDSTQGVYFDSTQGVYFDSAQGLYSDSTQGVYRVMQDRVTELFRMQLAAK